MCAALLAERDAEIAFSPGFRWGTTVLPDSAHHGGRHVQRDGDQLSAGVSREHDRTAHQGSAGRCRRRAVQQRSLSARWAATWSAAAGCATASIRARRLGSRISTLQHNPSGKAIDPAKTYAVAGWGSIADQRPGPTGLGSDRELPRPHQDRAHQAANQRPGGDRLTPGFAPGLLSPMTAETNGAAEHS